MARKQERYCTDGYFHKYLHINFYPTYPVLLTVVHLLTRIQCVAGAPVVVLKEGVSEAKNSLGSRNDDSAAEWFGIICGFRDISVTPSLALIVSEHNIIQCIFCPLPYTAINFCQNKICTNTKFITLYSKGSFYLSPYL